MKRLTAICVSFMLIFLIAHTHADSREDMMRDYEKLTKKGWNKVDSHRSFISKWKDNIGDLTTIYEKAASSSPNDPVVLYALGYVYATGDSPKKAASPLRDKAIQQFQTALDLKPDFLLAHFSVGSMYLRSKNDEQAEVEFRSAAKLLDKSASAKIIHPNAAARTKSRLSAKIKSLKGN